MKSLARIYMMLASGVLVTAVILVTAVKLTNRNPLAPTVATPQMATEQTEPAPTYPPLSRDEIGITVRFEGLAANGPETVLADIRIVSGSAVFDRPRATFTRQFDGAYATRILTPEPSHLYINIPLTITITGEKHLEVSFPQTQLTLRGYTDLSDKLLPAGDLNLPVISQNGVIDAVDSGYVESMLFTDDGTADVNYDGIVNAGDLLLVTDNIGK